MLRKLTSRKFWIAVTSFISLILVAFNIAESEATQISAIIMAGASIVAYIFGEAWIDSTNIDE